MRYLITGKCKSGKKTLMKKMKERGIKTVSIITPDEIESEAKKFPDSPFVLIYVSADYDLRKSYSVHTAEEEIEFRQKCTEEQESFQILEKNMRKAKEDKKLIAYAENIIQIAPIENDYEETTLSVWAEIFLRNERKWQNMLKIIRFSVNELGIMKKGDDGKDSVVVQYEDRTHKSVPIELFAETLLRENEGLLLLFRNVLESADITLTARPITKELQ